MSAALRLPPAYRLIAFDRLDSTNEEAKRLAADGAEDGTLVWARSQSAGRGRRGRSWESPPGNLYLSLILRPDCALAQAAQLGMVAAVAMGDAIGTVMPPLTEVWLKWPNDILVNGAKVGGILLESSARAADELEWLVLGIGVNVESYPENTAFPATCLGQESPEPVTVEQLLAAFGRWFLSWTNTWLEDGFAPVRAAWLARAWKRGEPIQVRVEGQTLDGIFHDLDADGALLLELAGGERRCITAADVFATPATP
jgi:BirA family biotin operon repressor/biotin-[acetyl-CoA-carboxylase] ligase